MMSDSSVAPNNARGGDVLSSDTSNREAPSGDVEQMLRAAQAGAAEPVGRLLALYRNYLLVLATTQFDRRLRRRVSPSDLVQDALLAAHRDFKQFNGQGERQFLAWLRQILLAPRPKLHRPRLPRLRRARRSSRYCLRPSKS